MASGRLTKKDSVFDGTIEKRNDSHRCGVSNLQVVRSLENGSNNLLVFDRSGCANCTRLRRVYLLRIFVQVSFYVRFSGMEQRCVPSTSRM